MRLLTYTSLYPNAAQPNHGIFIENRLRKLVASGQVEGRIVAPVPWFPLKGESFGKYGIYAQAPKAEDRHGLSILHPRYPVVPKIGMNWAPWLMYRATLPVLARMRQQGYEFQAIDAHYFYPDGVAAALIGQRLNVPVVITSRGSDISFIPQFPGPRRMIQQAAGQAAALITVCQALKDGLLELGVPDEKITVLRNGVDLETFRPMEREAARAKLGLTRPTLISVGALIPLKGNHLTIEALASLPEYDFLLAGEGSERTALEAQAASLGIADRVRFLGRIPHHELAEIYNAADAMILASSREGWANVLLEAMACGTPVVASDVWGMPEVVGAPAAGLLMKERSAAGAAEGIKALFANPPTRAETRAYAEGFDWDATTQGQIELYRRVIGEA